MLRYKKRTDKGTTLKCIDLINDDLKMTYFIMFSILILASSVASHCRNRNGNILVIKAMVSTI